MQAPALNRNIGKIALKYPEPARWIWKRCKQRLSQPDAVAILLDHRSAGERGRGEEGAKGGGQDGEYRALKADAISSSVSGSPST